MMNKGENLTRNDLQAVLERVEMIALRLDSQGNITFCNDYACRLSGWTRLELLGQNWIDICAPDKLPLEAQQMFRETLDVDHFPVHTENEIVTKSGQMCQIAWNNTIFRDQQGYVTDIICIGQDITAHKRIEQAYLALVEYSLQGLVILQDEPVVFVNPALAEISGYSIEVLLSLSWDDIGNIIHPHDRAWVIQLMRDLLVGKKISEHAEFRFKRKDGSIRYIETFASHIDYNSHPAVQVACIDITERKRQEQELLKAKHLLEKTFASLNEAVFVIDATGQKIVTCNPAAERIFGYSKASLVGNSMEMLHIDPEAYAQFYQLGASVLAESGVFQTEFRMRHRDGQLIITDYTVTTIVDEVGWLNGMVIVVRDITKRKKYEERCQRHAKRIEVLHKIDRAIQTAQTPQEIAQAATYHLNQLIPCCRASIMVYDFQRNRACFLATEGQGETQFSVGTTFRLNTIAALPALQQGEASLIEDLSAVLKPDYMQQILVAEGVRTYLNIPLLAHRQLIGSLCLGFAIVTIPEEDYLDIAQEIADQLAIAMENANLYLQIQKHAEELECRVAERTAELEQYYRQQAFAEERQRLARDLHDAVSQTLFSSSIIAETLPRLWDRNPELVRHNLVDLERLNRGALAEMRALLLELRPAALQKANLTDLLQQLVDALAGQSQSAVSLKIEAFSPPPSDVKLAFFRIAQEALNNIAKHARADQIEINLGPINTGGLLLRVVDDGRGFNPAWTPAVHLGLSIMRERAEGVGANMKIASRPGQGARIEVIWPGT